MHYRTKTYIAAAWDEDKEVVDTLRMWNSFANLSLNFTDAHELTQARDTSLCCSVKRSLSERMNASKTFVLIVGAKTKDLTKGSCQYCDFYLPISQKCLKEYQSVDLRSYIEYECEKALKDGLKIVVIYNYLNVDKSKCPEVLRDVGTHIPAYIKKGNETHWNYQEIKDAIMK